MRDREAVEAILDRDQQPLGSVWQAYLHRSETEMLCLSGSGHVSAGRCDDILMTLSPNRRRERSANRGLRQVYRTVEGRDRLVVGQKTPVLRPQFSDHFGDRPNTAALGGHVLSLGEPGATVG